MELEILLLMGVIMWCDSMRLSPMENNDKLQNINNLYVAEWQWESWPVKQELTEQEGKSPGQRKNFALWRDSSKSAWYLFGGQPINGDPKKKYSDVWKFTIKTRVWKRFYSFQEEVKEPYTNKRGAAVAAEINQGSNAFNFEPGSHKVILCGGLEKKNLTKTKNLSMWNTFRRKKSEEDKSSDELLYLAVYAPKASKPETVWQIDVKKKFWTAHVCSSNTTSHEREIKITNSSMGPIKEKMPNLSAIPIKNTNKNISVIRNTDSVFDLKINDAEDKAENERQNLNFSNLKNKKKKINQTRKSNDKTHLKQIKIDKKVDNKKERSVNESKFKTGEFGGAEEKKESTDHKYSENENDTKDNTEKRKEELVLNLKTSSETSEKKPEIAKFDQMTNIKIAEKDCPDISEGEASVTWCDRKNQAFVIADINSSQIKLHVFNLSIGLWSQLEVVNGEDKWEACTNKNSIRYTGNEEEIYVICSQTEKQKNASNKSLQDSTNFSNASLENSFNTKLVYRINYRERTFRSLGKILLNPFFNSEEGEKVWQNDTQSVLEVLKNSENETILIFAYLNNVDLWFLSKNWEDKESFELIEKIWRGSAVKWFDKYNLPLYSLQFVSETGNSETILLPNPRNIEANEYWPRERGRFIIRVFRNENLKNQTFENRTRDQNLTYGLLQSDYKPSGGEHQLNQVYSLKVLVFFGISLTIFTVFGLVIFLKRCVSCPPKIRIRNECRKYPLIIRYSVIPDDLLYPVA